VAPAVITVRPGQAITVQTAELLEWHSVAAGCLPDAELTVMVWFKDRAGITYWCGGWWTGERWLDVATGDDVWGTVLYWAQPEGPTCCTATETPPLAPAVGARLDGVIEPSTTSA